MRRLLLMIVALSMLGAHGHIYAMSAGSFAESQDIGADKQQTAQAPLEPNPSIARVEINLTPTGAEIQVDGNVIGTSPSEIRITEGDHKLLLKKAGFSDWECELTLRAGSRIYLEALLQRSSIK